jgi:hypothetical protein
MGEMSKDDEEIIKGLIVSLDETNPQRLNKKKQGIELGRTCGFALRVKHEFSLSERFGYGTESLLRNQFYFGNDPGDKIENTNLTKPYFIRDWLGRIIRSEDKPLIEIFMSLISTLGLSAIDSDDEYHKLMSRYVVTYDSFVKKHYTPIFQKKRGGNEVLVGYSKPNKPGVSPCLTTAENTFIRRILTPVFEELDDFSKDVAGFIKKYGYQACKDKVSEVYKLRKQIRKRFADVTTKRLQGIRKMLKNANLKKKDVTAENVMSFLKEIENPVRYFTDQIVYILGSITTIEKCVLGAFENDKKFASSEDSVKDILSYEVHVMYTDAKIYSLPKELQKQLVEKKDFEKLFEMGLTASKNFSNRYQTLNGLIRKGSNIKEVFAKRVDVMLNTFFNMLGDYEKFVSLNIGKFVDALITVELADPLFTYSMELEQQLYDLTTETRLVLLRILKEANFTKQAKDLSDAQIPKPFSKEKK